MSNPAELSVGSFAPLDDLDPATPGDPFTRLHYHYGQLLGAEDFNTEQRYFLLRSRLHNAVLHGFGTVWGLKVGFIETETALRLTCDAEQLDLAAFVRLADQLALQPQSPA